MQNILVFGDSIAWGSYDPKGGGWVNRLRSYYEENSKDDVFVYNLSIDNETSTDMVNRIKAECEARNPNLIIFAIGANDAMQIGEKGKVITSERKFRRNILKLIETAEDYTDDVVFAGPFEVLEKKTTPVRWNPGKYYKNKNIENYSDIINEQANKHHKYFINLFSFLREDEYYDGFHPNSKGHELIAMKIRHFLFVNEIAKY